MPNLNSDNGDGETRVEPQKKRPAYPARVGTYEVIKQLGEGGMGVVLLAHDRDLHRDVAIKLVRGELQSHEAFIQRFFREARLCAALNHPNVVTTYQVGQHDGMPFIVLEYVDGKSLRDLLRTPPPLKLSRILSIIAQAADGLEAAAKRGIVHRDVKPANIMVRHDDLVKVMDFGLSKEVEGECLTMTSALVGTPDFMSPEQAAGRVVDFRTDIYALGITMFQCLTGYLPFKSSSVFETIRMHAEKPLPEDAYIASLFDGRLLRLLKNMTAKRFEQRLSDYGELRRELRLLRDLAEMLPEGQKSVTPTPPVGSLHDVIERTETEAKAAGQTPAAATPRRDAAPNRSRRVAKIAATLAAVLVTGGIAAYMAQNPTRPSEPAHLPTPVPVSQPQLAVVSVRNVIPGPVTINSGYNTPSTAADILQSIGALGSNHLVAKGLSPDRATVAFSFHDRTPLDVLECLSLAMGWTLKNDAQEFRVISPATVPRDEQITLMRESLTAEQLPRVSANTVGQHVTIRMFCEAVSKQTELDYLISDQSIAIAAFPEGSFTNRPLPMMMELINKNSIPVEWTVYKSTLIITSTQNGSK